MLIYNLVVRLYALMIHLGTLNKTKARQWVQGRKNWRKKLSKDIAALSLSKKVWVHCASYGEFEQGRPLMEAIRAKHPEYKIVLTFFSPSGYEAFKSWPGADVICYLPLDTRPNARDFLDIVKPQAVVFIKYEFWLNYLFQLRKNNIPTFLVSAVFKSHHPFFKWYGSLFRKSLSTFTELFIQDKESGKLLETIAVKNYQVSGDTRFDRVVEIKENFKPIDYFEKYCTGSKVIIAGSSWPKDEELLINAFIELNDSRLKLVFAPHHVEDKDIRQLENLLTKKQLPYSLYSDGKPDPSKPVLIVNAMGLLNKIYHYANITYIGGGFNSGIHNCLEPAVYLKPVLFYGGSDYHKYNEAVELIEMGVAINIVNPEETPIFIRALLNDEARLSQIREKLEEYFQKKSGTTQKVMAMIKW
ncbi:MAG: 3-deoxy-D-manno-octulosonic acid transferase [Bacteroidia bacterium]|nr:3-deoxy-D-manno-octulosonic acid transferase [Bacteroidia bacterium]